MKTLNSRLFATALVGGLLIAPQAASAAGFANTAHSATSTGMGGVGAANPDEPNASFYNPAAMTARDGFNVYLGPTIITPIINYDGPGESEDSKTDSVVSPPPNFHLSVPFGDMAVGVGVVFPWGLVVDWPDEWAGREIIRRQRLTTVDINPNFAYRLEQLNLSVAAGVQVILASVELENTTIVREDREVNAHIGGNGVGFGGTGALLFRPTDNLTFGLNYRSAVKVDIEGRAHFEGEEGTPFETTFVDQAGGTSITMPHYVVAGVSYLFEDKLFLEFDLGVTTWSSHEEIRLEFERPCEPGDTGCTPGEDTNPPTTVIDQRWQDSPTFRFGAQYNVTAAFPIRVGAAWDMTPIPAETVSPSLPGNDRAVFSVGTGYTVSGFRGDLAYMLVTTGRNITNGNQNGAYATTAHLIGINVGYGY